MNIVLVKWTIKKGMEQEFLDYWRSLRVKNPGGLFREMLSKVGEDEVNTWQFPIDEYSIYINVGIWESAEAFKTEIGDYMRGETQPFEAERRQRVLLESVALDRGGKFSLPPAML